MGLIKEPVGVDFVINSRQLTKKEESAISAYIATYKAKSKADKIQNRLQPKAKRTKKVSQ